MNNSSDQSLSLTAMTAQFRQYGLDRNALLSYLVNDLMFVKDIRTITGLGMENGVSYKYKDSNPSERWPVYNEEVIALLHEKAPEIIQKYASACQQSKQTTRSSQPEKIPAQDYPPTEEIFNPDFDTFVAYDFETTGFRTYDAIIEFGAVKVVDGIVRESASFTFQELVKPYKCSVNERITDLTGITPEDVRYARPIWEVTKDFHQFVGDHILIGYNNISFDAKFLERAGRISGIPFYNRQFDVMKLYKRRSDCERRGSMNLAAAANRFHIENPRAHRALADSLTTARVYLALKNLY